MQPNTSDELEDNKIHGWQGNGIVNAYRSDLLDGFRGSDGPIILIPCRFYSHEMNPTSDSKKAIVQGPMICPLYDTFYGIS